MGLLRDIAQVLPAQNGLQQPQANIPQMGGFGGFGGMMGAFGNSPQFQQQLGQIMQGQGPGMQPPQFTSPQLPVGTGPNGGANMWNDGIPGNARAAGIPRPGMGGFMGGGMMNGPMGLMQSPFGSQGTGLENMPFGMQTMFGRGMR